MEILHEQNTTENKIIWNAYIDCDFHHIQNQIKTQFLAMFVLKM